MSEIVIQLDDQLASRLSRVASEEFNGDKSAVISEALLLLFLQPIAPKRRKLAQSIYELREQARNSGGVSDQEISQLVHRYRDGNNKRS